MTASDVADFAAQGVTRLVVPPGSAGLSEELDQISAFAERLGLARPS